MMLKSAAVTNVQPETLQERSVVTKTRILNVKIDGTIDRFAQIGSDAALWRPAQGQHGMIFGVDQKWSNNTMSINKAFDVDALNAAISNVTIKHVSLQQCHNTFKIPLGVTINCIPGMECTDTGETYAFTTIPETTVNYPQTLYETSEDCTKADIWRKRFPEYNSENLETQGVLEIKNCPYIFVHQNHPVISLLTMNPDIVGTDISACGKVDTDWYKVTPNVLHSSCQAIRAKILSLVPTQNLSNFQVQLHKLGGGDWSDVQTTDLLSTFKTDASWTPSETETKLKIHEQLAKSQPECFMARIKIVYDMRPP